MRKRMLMTALCSIATPFSVNAQDTTPNEGWTINAGVGALLSPNYLGDDAYSLSSVPYIHAAYGDRFFASVQEGAGYNLVAADRFRAGPLARLEFGRDEDGTSAFRIAGKKTDDLRGLGDIDTSISLGGFAEVDLGNITASAVISQALGGHDGATGDVSLSYNGTYIGMGPPVIYSLGPRLKFGDDTYMSSFFGVDGAQAQASGLSPFSASGGAVSFGVSGTAIMPLTETLSVTLLTQYTHLTGDAANASLVKEKGSSRQAFIGIVTAIKIK